MRQTTIGQTGISVAPVSMGTWAMGGGFQWGESDDRLSLRAIDHALDSGIQWIDTAPAYGFGHSEELVGQAIRGKREQVFLATKCGLQWYNTTGTLHLKKDGYSIYRDLTPAGIRRDLELSLKRIGTDYIDLYLTHWQSGDEPFIPVEETMGALLDLKKEGLIRAIGACNVTPAQVEQYVACGPLDVVQQKYSMLMRSAEEFLPLCQAHGITLQTYSPLEQGLLTDQAARTITLQPGNARYNNLWWRPGNREKVIAMLDGWHDLCEKYACPMSNLIIAWTIARSEHFNVLCGARKPEQVDENAGGLRVELSAEDFGRMNRDADRVIAEKTEG